MANLIKNTCVETIHLAFKLRGHTPFLHTTQWRFGTAWSCQAKDERAPISPRRYCAGITHRWQLPRRTVIKNPPWPPDFLESCVVAAAHEGSNDNKVRNGNRTREVEERSQGQEPRDVLGRLESRTVFFHNPSSSSFIKVIFPGHKLVQYLELFMKR